MKLCAIIVVWDCLELLPYAIENVRPNVDGIILVWSKYSNRGNIGQFNLNDYRDCYPLNFEPDLKKKPHDNERAKRNAGLEKAKRMGFTHFLMLDADEMYDAEEFEREKQRMIKHDLNGLVCRCAVYFKEPTLTIGLDPVTYVPFIHKLKPETRFELNRKYPFSYDENGVNHIDPTRKLNYTSGVEWSNITMHHFSYVRNDIQQKINNSSSDRLKTSTAYDDWINADEGYFVKLYQRTLERCDNKFNIQLNP